MKKTLDIIKAELEREIPLEAHVKVNSYMIDLLWGVVGLLYLKMMNVPSLILYIARLIVLMLLFTVAFRIYELTTQ